MLTQLKENIKDRKQLFYGVVIGVLLLGVCVFLIANDGKVKEIVFGSEGKEGIVSASGEIKTVFGSGNTDGKTYYVNKTRENNQTYYKLEMPNITIKTLTHTTCYWGKDPLRHCIQNINITGTKAVLSVNDFNNEFKTEQFKSFKVEQFDENTIRISFDYPPNAGEEWNITFNDGTTSFKIDPEISACSVLNTAGETYLLTDDIIDNESYYCMNIQTSNITLDCQGHLIDGTNTYSDGYGVYVSSQGQGNLSNINIRNCNISEWFDGVFFELVVNGTIYNNTISLCQYSIATESINNITISNNIIRNNVYVGILTQKASSIGFSRNNLISNNTIFLVSEGYDDGLEGISFQPISDSLIVNNNIYGVGICLTFYSGSFNNTIYNNLFNCSRSFDLIYSEGVNWFNVTEQIGTRVYSNGINIGGNYYIKEGECLGQAVSCGNLINQTSCEEQQWCYWEIDTCYDDGLVSCTTIDNSESCLTQDGCSWNSTSKGYSNDCTDIDIDGFCDNPFDLDTRTNCTTGINCGNNVDYLPYSNKYSADTCTYTSGNWNVLCSDNCIISSPITGDGSDMIMSGAGSIVFNANVTGFSDYFMFGSCNAYCRTGCVI